MCVKSITITKMPQFFCVAISTKNIYFKEFFLMPGKKITPTKLP